MADFYTRAFGWQTRQFDEKMGNYVLVTTTETDAKGRPATPALLMAAFTRCFVYRYRR